MAGERDVREMPRKTLPDAPLTARGPHKTAQPKRRLINLRDVAIELDVSFDTIDRYIRKGQLQVVVLPSGRRRVAREDLDKAIENWKAMGR